MDTNTTFRDISHQNNYHPTSSTHDVSDVYDANNNSIENIYNNDRYSDQDFYYFNHRNINPYYYYVNEYSDKNYFDFNLYSHNQFLKYNANKNIHQFCNYRDNEYKNVGCFIATNHACIKEKADDACKRLHTI